MGTENLFEILEILECGDVPKNDVKMESTLQ